MTTAPTTNGKPPRKQLSHQLDRLDRIIDVMADDLPEAVAAASRDGTREAIRAVLIEVLADPDVLARLRATLQTVSPPSAPAKPTAEPHVPPSRVTPDRFARLRAAARTTYQRVAEEVRAGAAALRGAVVRAKRRVATAVAQLAATVSRVTTVARVLTATLPLRRFLVVAAAVAVVAAAAGYVLPRPAAAALGGLGGGGATLAVQLGLWLRRVIGPLGR